MIKPKLRSSQQCPNELPARLGLAVLAAGDVLAERLTFLGRRRPREYAAHRRINQFAAVGDLREPAEQPVAAVGEEFLLEPVAVAEQQRLADADLRVVAALVEGRCEATGAAFE